MAQQTGVAPTPPNPNAEPEVEWKDALRKEIEASLLPMYNDAKEAREQKLKEAPVDVETRERLAKEHSDTLKNIRRIADDIYRDQVEQERQQLRWAQGGTLAHEWSGGLVRQQQAIMEQIEKERRGSSRASSSQLPATNHSRQQSQWAPGDSPTSERDAEYFSRIASRGVAPVSPGYVAEDRVTGRPRNTSGASGYEHRYSGERLGDYTRSAIVDEPEDMDQPGRPYPEGKGSFRRQSNNVGPKGIPEIWKPSISPEEDAALSRTSTLARRGSISSIQSNSYRSPTAPHFADHPEHTLARQGSVSSFGPNSYRSPSAAQFPDRSEHKPVARQGSISSFGSYLYRPPSTSQIPEYPEPYRDNIAANVERERSGIQAAEEEWNDISRSRERQARIGQDGRYRSGSGAKRGEEHSNVPSPTSAGPSPVAGHSLSGVPVTSSRPVDIRSHSSGLTASRPMANERPFSVDESSRFPQSSSPLSQGWAGPTRASPNNRPEPGRSRSPPTPIDNTRYRQPAHLRPQVSTHDLQRDHQSPMMMRSTSKQDAETDDDDDWQEEDVNSIESESHHARQMEEEAWRKDRETRLKEEEIKRMAEEVQRKEEAARRQQAEARRRAEEAERLEREAKAKEEAARLKEEETRAKEAEIKRREEEVRRREEELERREAEARRKEEEKKKRQQEETRKRELEARRRETEKREAELKQRELDLERREAEARRKEKEEEREEREAIRLVEEMQRRDAETLRKEKLQQEEFRKREEEIRRRAYERRSQEEHEFFYEGARPTGAKPSTSPPPTAPWTIPNRSSPAGTSPQADRNSTSGSSWTSSSSRPSFNPSTPASSTRTSTSSTTTKPATNTPRSAGFAAAGAKTTPSATPNSETEWARRQEEQARKQQEAFRREQEQQEMKRQAQAGKILSKEDVLQLFSTHERQWAALPSSEELLWHNFPWPVWKTPKDPEDLTSTHIGAYVLSQYYPGDKSKSTKDRIKEHIRRWHPDRFETKYLPKVREGDREKVKEGAGVVARVLNEMLTRSNVHDVFG
jgi:hypothetical protein